jgi:hypothetical protein
LRSLRNLEGHPASVPLTADEILEFHAARLLLLLKLSGQEGRIEGLTKMAKLDFFVRYPQFFALASGTGTQDNGGVPRNVESKMIRLHYGPWDRRYYHVLAYLEGTGLVRVSSLGRGFTLALTEEGAEMVARLERDPSFAELCEQMRQVKQAFGRKSGTALKKLIYAAFDREVGERRLGEVIE